MEKLRGIEPQNTPFFTGSKDHDWYIHVLLLVENTEVNLQYSAEIEGGAFSPTCHHFPCFLCLSGHFKSHCMYFCCVLLPLCISFVYFSTPL